jgi:hypothetical protein
MTAPKERRDAASAATGGELDGRALAASLAVTLLELGVTLTASFFFSRWIAKMVQQTNNGAAAGGGGGADGMDGFQADNGGGDRGGVVTRLRNLLESRHEAALRAATEEELENCEDLSDCDDCDDDDGGRREEKKEDPPRRRRVDDARREDAPDDEGGRARRRALALREELRLHHERSLSSLETLTPYELSIAQNNLIDPSCLSVDFADVGGMDEIKSEVYDLVVMPLLRPDLFVSDSGLVSPPKGILLYG